MMKTVKMMLLTGLILVAGQERGLGAAHYNWPNFVCASELYSWICPCGTTNLEEECSKCRAIGQVPGVVGVGAPAPAKGSLAAQLKYDAFREAEGLRKKESQDRENEEKCRELLYDKYHNAVNTKKECPFCTEINKRDAAVCEHCLMNISDFPNTARVLNVGVPSMSASGAGCWTGSPVPQEWECTTCALWNAPTSSNCEACLTPKTAPLTLGHEAPDASHLESALEKFTTENEKYLSRAIQEITLRETDEEARGLAMQLIKAVSHCDCFGVAKIMKNHFNSNEIAFNAFWKKVRFSVFSNVGIRLYPSPVEHMKAMVMGAAAATGIEDSRACGDKFTCQWALALITVETDRNDDDHPCR
jgi:hypothetical protein